jgi:hypothetical protein
VSTMQFVIVVTGILIGLGTARPVLADEAFQVCREYASPISVGPGLEDFRCPCWAGYVDDGAGRCRQPTGPKPGGSSDVTGPPSQPRERAPAPSPRRTNTACFDRCVQTHQARTLQCNRWQGRIAAQLCQDGKFPDGTAMDPKGFRVCRGILGAAPFYPNRALCIEWHMTGRPRANCFGGWSQSGGVEATFKFGLIRARGTMDSAATDPAPPGIAFPTGGRAAYCEARASSGMNDCQDAAERNQACEHTDALYREQQNQD